MKSYCAVAVMCALFMTALVLTGCGDSEPQADGYGFGVARVRDDVDDEPGKNTEGTPKAGGEKDGTESNTEKRSSVSTAPEDGMEKLALALPDPVFIGTPTNFTNVKLPEDIGESRGDVYVPRGTKLLSAGKPVTSSWDLPIIGELEYITDGSKEPHEGNYLTLGPGKQWVQIDLMDSWKIAAIVVWHFHMRARVYRDVGVQVSNDKDFTQGVTTIFNNDYDNSLGLGVGKNYEYVETNEGKLIDACDVKGRYVRLYSKGNTESELNNYIEVAVYGRPAD